MSILYVGIDLAKNVFAVHGVNGEGQICRTAPTQGQPSQAERARGSRQGRSLRPPACECEAECVDAAAGHRLANNVSTTQQASSQKMK